MSRQSEGVPEGRGRATRIEYLEQVALTGLLLVLLVTLGGRHAQAAPGDLDPTFGGDGIVFPARGEARALVLQPDGKLVVTGSGFVLVRLNDDGSLDPTFGTGGTVITDFSNGVDQSFALVLQPDGKLVAAGRACDASVNNCDPALARYNPDGSLDPTFGTSGRVITKFGGGDFAHALIQQGEGKLVAAGSIGGPGRLPSFALIRYMRDIGNPPHVALSTNQAGFIPGDFFRLFATFQLGTQNNVVDGYVQVQIPGGQVFYLLPNLVSFSSIPTSVVQSFAISDLSNPLPITTLRVSSDLPPGTYTFSAFGVAPGSNPLDPANRRTNVAMTSVSLTITPCCP